MTKYKLILLFLHSRKQILTAKVRRHSAAVVAVTHDHERVRLLLPSAPTFGRIVNCSTTTKVGHGGVCRLVTIANPLPLIHLSITHNDDDNFYLYIIFTNPIRSAGILIPNIHNR